MQDPRRLHQRLRHRRLLAVYTPLILLVLFVFIAWGRRDETKRAVRPRRLGLLAGAIRRLDR
ncbi:hypothetical protein ACFYOW_11610 [Nocardia sp. NPDC006982]|uniref:hypothetical protein n=1 Tax=Nocardia sp. NPDC006982 TaxID=3364307 RepID=UPI0036802555